MTPAEQALVIASNSIQLVAIVIFDFLVFKLLKNRGQGLDMYMKTMIVLLTASVIMI